MSRSTRISGSCPSAADSIGREPARAINTTRVRQSRVVRQQTERGLHDENQYFDAGGIGRGRRMGAVQQMTPAAVASLPARQAAPGDGDCVKPKLHTQCRREQHCGCCVETPRRRNSGRSVRPGARLHHPDRPVAGRQSLPRASLERLQVLLDNLTQVLRRGRNFLKRTLRLLSEVESR